MVQPVTTPKELPFFTSRDTADRATPAGSRSPATCRHLSQWDVLIGHGLGVDHAGHIHAVDSAEMRAKLAETDALIGRLVARLEAEGGPGGQHENTLLLVMGDHGQTMHGDHGGGSPDETDTALFAYAPRGEARAG